MKDFNLRGFNESLFAARHLEQQYFYAPDTPRYMMFHAAQLMKSISRCEVVITAQSNNDSVCIIICLHHPLEGGTN